MALGGSIPLAGTLGGMRMVPLGYLAAAAPVKEAIAQADVVVLAVPFDAIKELKREDLLKCQWQTFRGDASPKSSWRVLLHHSFRTPRSLPVARLVAQDRCVYVWHVSIDEGDRLPHQRITVNGERRNRRARA